MMLWLRVHNDVIDCGVEPQTALKMYGNATARAVQHKGLKCWMLWLQVLSNMTDVSMEPQAALDAQW